MSGELSIPKLSLVVLIGVSGSGKSTFARTHFRGTEVISSDLARAHDVLPVVIVLDVPESLCVQRNAGRTDRDFGADVIRRQRAQLRRGLRGLKREGFHTVHVREYLRISYGPDYTEPSKANRSIPDSDRESAVVRRVTLATSADQCGQCSLQAGRGAAEQLLEVGGAAVEFTVGRSGLKGGDEVGGAFVQAGGKQPCPVLIQGDGPVRQLLARYGAQCRRELAESD